MTTVCGNCILTSSKHSSQFRSCTFIANSATASSKFLKYIIKKLFYKQVLLWHAASWSSQGNSHHTEELYIVIFPDVRTSDSDVLEAVWSMWTKLYIICHAHNESASQISIRLCLTKLVTFFSYIFKIPPTFWQKCKNPLAQALNGQELTWTNTVGDPVSQKLPLLALSHQSSNPSSTSCSLTLKA